MSGPADDLPPTARDVVESIAAAPTTPAKFVVVGGMGTGKTTTLTAIRSALRAAGISVMTRPPQAGRGSRSGGDW